MTTYHSDTQTPRSSLLSSADSLRSAAARHGAEGRSDVARILWRSSQALRRTAAAIGEG